MNWRITFYNKKVKSQVLAFPEGALASFLHIAELVILNAFVKKTQKTPKKEIALARKPMKEVLK